MKFSEAAESGARLQPGEDRVNVGPHDHVLGRHIKKAHTTVKGEHQLPEYVRQLGLDECVEILAASPVGLPALASRHEQCRVEAGEQRGFDEVIRTWTVYLLSVVEGG
jgi:hypothetical protein